MTKPSDFPFDVRRFIERRIRSIEQLEILMVLHREPSRFWNAKTISERLHLIEPQALDGLEALALGGLLDVRISSEVVYRFSPATPAIARDVVQLAELYTRRRGELLALVTSGRHRLLKDFSDAFRLTDDPDENG